MADLDMTEVFKLANDLGNTSNVARDARKVIQKSSQNIKQRMQREAAGHKMAPGIPGAITFDTGIGSDGLTGEIGPQRGGPGSLAFYYYGNSRVGPSIPDPQIALDAESETTADELAKIGEAILGDS